jgi:hypothetical protein
MSMAMCRRTKVTAHSVSLSIIPFNTLTDDLWTAPELLRQPMNDRVALEEHVYRGGDIYSLAIIMHELYGREGPWGDSMLEPAGGGDSLV